MNDWDYLFDAKHKKKVNLPCRKGSNNTNSKISQDTALSIKALLLQGLGQSEIARHLKVSRNIVSNIKHNRAWTHL